MGYIRYSAIIYFVFAFFFISCINLYAQWHLNTAVHGGDANVLTYDGERFYCGLESGGIYLSDDNGMVWFNQHPALITNPINSILLKDTIIFAGSGSGVFISSDRGENWTESDYGLPPYSSIKSLASLDTFVFAALYSNIYATTNNGVNWFFRGSGIMGHFINCLTVKGSYIFAGTMDGIYFSSDYGTEWTERDTGIGAEIINHITVSGNSLFASTGFDLYSSTDNGLNWTLSGSLPGYVYSLIVIDSVLYASTYFRGVYSSDDEGSTWIKISEGHPELNYVNVLGNIGNLLFAGTPSNIYEHNTSDSVWIERDQGMYGVDLNCMDANDNKIVMTGSGGKIFISSNNGNTWLENRIENIYSFVDLALKGDTICVVNNSDFYYSANNGQHWYGRGWGNDVAILCMDIYGDKIVLGTFEPGGILISTDGGNEFVEKSSDMIIDDIVCTNNRIIAGTDAGLYSSTDDGNSWELKIYNVFVSKIEIIGQNIYADTDYGIYFSSDGGANWSYRGSINGLITSFAGYDSVVYAGTMNNIYQSKDYGHHWESIAEGLPRNWINSLIVYDTTLFAGIRGNGLWTRSAIVTSAIPENRMIPKDLILFQNYPNPFNPSTTIKYSIAEKSNVTLKIYDLLGSEIETLINEEKTTGNYEFIFNASNLPSGVYFYQLRAGSFVETKKMMLMK